MLSWKSRIRSDHPPLQALRHLIAESRIALPAELPPMSAGVFGYLGYDMVRQMEELPAPIPIRSACRTPILIRPTLIIVFDAVKDTITVVTPVRPDNRGVAKCRAGAGLERLSSVVDALDRPLDKSAANFDPGPLRA